MTWYDQVVKCKKFLRDSEKHFKTAKMINLDSIRREVAGEKVLDKVLQVLKYQAIKNETGNNESFFKKGFDIL